jgi:hypothetical protein
MIMIVDDENSIKLKIIDSSFQNFSSRLVGPHDEILRNLLTSKTGNVEIALRLGFGINLVSSISMGFFEFFSLKIS